MVAVMEIGGSEAMVVATVVVWEAAGSNPCAGPSLAALQLARREPPFFVPPLCKPIDASQPLWWRVYDK